MMSSSAAAPIRVVAIKSFAGLKKESIPPGLLPPVVLSFKKKQVMTLVDWNEEHDYILAQYKGENDKQRKGWFPASYVCVIHEDGARRASDENMRQLTQARLNDWQQGVPSLEELSDTGSESGDGGGSGDGPQRAWSGEQDMRLSNSRWSSEGNLKKMRSAAPAIGGTPPVERSPSLLAPRPVLHRKSGSDGGRDSPPLPVVVQKRRKSPSEAKGGKGQKQGASLEELLRQGSSSASFSQTSVPLHAVKPVDKRGIPLLVTSIIKHLRNNGMTAENLFRASGHGQEVREIQAAFKKEEPVDLGVTKNPHSCAVVLKLFLRELSEPLLTFDLHASFTASLALPTEERRLEHFKYLLELLPPQNYNVTACLAGFLYETVQHANENSLTLVQASRIFGQSFCRSGSYTIDREELEKSYLVTQHLIALHAKLFTDYLDVWNVEVDRKRMTRRKKEKEMMESYLKRESKERRKQEKKERKERKKRKKSEEPLSARRSEPNSPLLSQRAPSSGSAFSPRTGISPLVINSPSVERHAASVSPSLRRRRRMSARDLMESRETVVNTTNLNGSLGSQRDAFHSMPSVAMGARKMRRDDTPVIVSSDEDVVQGPDQLKTPPHFAVPGSDALMAKSGAGDGPVALVWGLDVVQWHRAFLGLLAVSLLLHVILLFL